MTLSAEKKYVESLSMLETQPVEQQSEVELLRKKVQDLEQQNEVLTELVCLLRGQKFAPKSEKASPDQLRLGDLFDEAEVSLEEEEKEETEVKSYKRGTPKRKPLPSNLPRKEEIVDLDESEKVCDECGSKLTLIGEVKSEKLDIEPMLIEIIERIRKKYACKSCESCVKTADLPKDPIPKSIATPGTLAFVTTSKYQDRLPLYHIEGILQRNGVDIPRNTLANWIIKCSDLVQPLINLLEDDILGSTYLKMDETTVQVLKEQGKKPTTKSYMWLRWRAGPDPIVLFEYDPTRSSKVPQRLLEGFSGYLQVDGYVGYNEICTKEEVIRVACMAHIRRKFKEAAKNSKHKARANYALKIIQRLYDVEKKAKDKAANERLELRKEISVSEFEKLEEWLKEMKPKVAPKSLLGKAIIYALKEWENMRHYLNDGALDIDNNLIENAIRPFAVGRKNWMFSNSVRGARASANLYSLIETAKANGLEPFAYLKHIYHELPKAETVEQMEKLLPAQVKRDNIFS